MESIQLDFICPLTKKIFVDPVITSLGTIYERFAITEWYLYKDLDPITKQKIYNKTLLPAIYLKNIIHNKFNNDFNFIQYKNNINCKYNNKSLVKKWNGLGNFCDDTSKNYFYGECKNGKYWNGHGKISYIQDKKKYFLKGTWKDGIFYEGEGYIIDKIKDKLFYGIWKNSKYWHGYGKININGTVYEGYILYGKMFVNTWFFI